MKLKTLLASAALALTALSSSAALIDNGSYTSDTSFGLDWLDLTQTQGQSVSAALSSNTGWSYATSNQVSDLLSSFGITYAFSNGTYIALSTSSAQALSFASLLGATTGNASLGGYDNLGVGHSTYLCISNGSCGPTSFTNDVDLSSGNGVIGQFLVRSSSVPEPSSLVLLGLGLAGLGLNYRKKAA